MSGRLYTEEELAKLRSMPKRVTNPGARWLEKPGHRQRNHRAVDEQGQEVNFSVYLRQNSQDDSDFSCGIVYRPLGGKPLTLARYNGSSHRHGDIHYRPHIHRATARAIASGKKPESAAEETDRYETLEGALRCLIEDFNLSGIAAPDSDPIRLFQ